MQTHDSYSSPEKCNPIQPYSPENYQEETPPPPSSNFVVVLSLFLFIYRPITNNG